MPLCERVGYLLAYGPLVHEYGLVEAHDQPMVLSWNYSKALHDPLPSKIS